MVAECGDSNSETISTGATGDSLRDWKPLTPAITASKYSGTCMHLAVRLCDCGIVILRQPASLQLVRGSH